VSSEDIVLAVIDALERTQVPYMVVGSLSSNLYGIPRSTKDADVVAQLDPNSIQALMKELGPQFRLDPQLSFETVTATTRYIIDTPERGFRIELFCLSQDPHDRMRFARRRRIVISGRPASAPSPEDVIITKLQWSKLGKRTKDVDDARNVIAVQRDALDWDYIHGWCDQHGTRALLDEIRRSIPPLEGHQ